MQMVYDLQLKAGVEVGMAALWFIHNEIFLQKDDQSQSHKLIDSILSGILVSSLSYVYWYLYATNLNLISRVTSTITTTVREV